MIGLESFINEGKRLTYHVSVPDVRDHEGLPVTVDMTVDATYQKAMEKWLKREEGNLFSNACGANTENEYFEY